MATITTKPAAKTAEVQIIPKSKEDLFNVGHDNHLGAQRVAYRQSPGRVEFIAGAWYLSFRKDKGKNLTLDLEGSSTDIIQHLDAKGHRMNCILSLIGYVAEKDGLKLPEGQERIKSRVDGAERLPHALLSKTLTFLVPNGMQSELVGYTKKIGKNADSIKGYLSVPVGKDMTNPQNLVFPFEISRDPKIKNHVLSLAGPNHPDLIMRNRFHLSDAELRVLNGYALSLARFIAAENAWSLITLIPEMDEGNDKAPATAASIANVPRRGSLPITGSQ